MTIAILSWVHNQKSLMDTILNRTNIGHCSMEITISKNKFREIVKRNSFFQEYHKVMNNYNKIYVDIFEIVENMEDNKEQIKKDTEEYIKSAHYAIKRKLPIEVLEKCYELQALQGKFDKFSCYSAFMPKAVYNGKQKNINIYFSFWPGEESRATSQQTLEQSNLTMRRKSPNDYSKTNTFVSNTFDADLNSETDGIDLENIFYDFRKENLEQIAIVPRNPDKDSKSWDKKDKIIYKVKSGKLAGLEVTAATYSSYYSLIHKLKDKRTFTHRLIGYNRNNEALDLSTPKDIQIKLETLKALETMLNGTIDTTFDLETIKDKIKEKQKKIDESNRKILTYEKLTGVKAKKALKRKENEKKYYGILYHENLKLYEEIRVYESKKAYLKLISDEVQYFENLLKTNIVTKGLPPTYVVTYPSLGLEGFGLDEEKIINEWIQHVIPAGYSKVSTNCSWAVLRAFSIESNLYSKAPLTRYITPITPLEFTKYAKNLQEILYKKYEINIYNFDIFSNYPSKKILELMNFKNLISRSNDLFIKNIIDLIDSYKKLAITQIKWRFKILDSISNFAHIWMSKHPNSRSTQTIYSDLNNLLTSVEIEYKNLIDFLTKEEDFSNEFELLYKTN